VVPQTNKKDMKNQTAEEMLAECVCLENVDELHHQLIRNAMHQFASQQSAIAVQKRDEEIREWTNQDKHRWGMVDPIELRRFLSTPTEPSAEIAQVEPTERKEEKK
jgi:predicted Rossmann fold nucleotide-binding protein DprA/Smf involved in DNA uptake